VPEIVDKNIQALFGECFSCLHFLELKKKGNFPILCIIFKLLRGCVYKTNK